MGKETRRVLNELQFTNIEPLFVKVGATAKPEAFCMHQSEVHSALALLRASGRHVIGVQRRLPFFICRSKI